MSYNSFVNQSTSEAAVVALLRMRKLSLALAESCTGGLVSHRITNIPGSSEVYLGGVTAYSNQVKHKVLGVTNETLESLGAVSSQCVLEMADGARRILYADIALAISGIAGPGGGTPEKPVGLVWIALCAHRYANSWCYQWAGNRQAVKKQTADQALQLLIDYLEKQ